MPCPQSAIDHGPRCTPPVWAIAGLEEALQEQAARKLKRPEDGTDTAIIDRAGHPDARDGAKWPAGRGPTVSLELLISKFPFLKEAFADDHKWAA